MPAHRKPPRQRVILDGDTVDEERPRTPIFDVATTYAIAVLLLVAGVLIVYVALDWVL